MEQNKKEKTYVIAIDGPSSTGKSTIAKQVAKKLGFKYIDSGAMYRAVALYFLNTGSDVKDPNFEKIVENELINIDIEIKYEKGEMRIFLNELDVTNEIRKNEVSKVVSMYSKISKVREKLLLMQREMAEESSVVMDGRDIGTAVFPNADVKLYIDASIFVRAKRRQGQLLKQGEEVSYRTVKNELIKRDEMDKNREIAPLQKAYDAIVIDNTKLNKNKTIKMAINIIQERTGIKID